MPKFVFAYHGGKAPDKPEEGEKVMAEWGAWYESMGAAVVDGGGPCGQSTTVSLSNVVQDGGANPLSGLSQIEAADMAAAVEMAKGCPMVKDGSGSVEICEVLSM